MSCCSSPRIWTVLNKEIGRNLKKKFESCVTGLKIPDSVTGIGNYAFQFCTGLKDIAIPDGVTEIRKGVFRYCESLTDITIPGGVTAIEESAF